MRINIFSLNSQNKQKYKASVNNATNPQYKNIELSNLHYRPLSFGCSGLDFNKQLESLSNIHCPCCGTKMLTQEEYEQLLEKSKNIQTKEEFLNFLNEHSENVPYKLRSIVKHLNKVSSDNPEFTLNHIVAIVKSGANKKIGYNLEHLANSLLESAKDETFSDNDRNLLLSCSKMLSEFKDSRRSKDEFKTILKETILKMESDKRHEIFADISTDFGKHNFRRIVLSGIDLENADVNTIAQVLTRNFFSHSISKVKKVNDINNDININYDKLLMCSNCANDQFAISNMLQGSRKSLYNYQTYIDDIFMKYATKEINLEHTYPITINGLIKKLSSGKLFKNEKSEVLEQIRKMNFELNRKIDFELVHVDGVPCLGCGQDTITHERKLEIYDELAKAQNKREMLDVLLKNKHIIKERYVNMLNLLDEILKKNPNISDEEALKILRQYTHDELQGTLLECLKYVERLLNKPHSYLNDKKLVTSFLVDFKNNYLNIDPQERFPFKAYGVLLNDTFGKMINTNSHKHMEFLKYSVKDKCSVQYILYPPPDALKKYDSIFEVVFQDIIKKSVATKDHFTARRRSGSDEKKNIILLCSECNKYKSNSKIWNWLLRTPNFDEYAKKHFEFVGEKIKSGEISPDNLDYLIGLQKDILDLTKGEIYIDFNPNNFVV